MPPDRDVERELGDLGPRVEYPPAPDLAGPVGDRLRAEGTMADEPARSGPQLWWIAAAAVVLLVALPVFAAILNGMGGALSGGAAGGAAESGGQGAVDEAGSYAPIEEGTERMVVGEREETAAIGIQAVRIPNEELVPDVIGMPVIEACSKLRPRDYVGSVLGEVESDRVPSGYVVSQKPRAGIRGFQGQPVELIVSEPYPAGRLGRDARCYDLTEYGPGGRPNVPNKAPN